MKTTDTEGLTGDKFGEDMEFIQALHNAEAFLAEKSWPPSYPSMRLTQVI